MAALVHSSDGTYQVMLDINSTLSDSVLALPILEWCALKWQDHLPAANVGLGPTAQASCELQLLSYHDTLLTESQATHREVLTGYTVSLLIA